MGLPVLNERPTQAGATAVSVVRHPFTFHRHSRIEPEAAPIPAAPTRTVCKTVLRNSSDNLAVRAGHKGPGY